MTFKTLGYQIIKAAVNKDVCRLMAEEFRLVRAIALASNKQNPSIRHPDSKQDDFPFADEMVNSSFSWYSPMCFEALSNSLIKEIVESTINEEVYPTYSYARIYGTGSEMKRHVDRSSSEFSVSCCIDIDTNYPNWPLWVETKEGIIAVQQEPGDIIIYEGHNLPHWREEYKGFEHINAFMFYVRANGTRSELKYDTRPALGMSPQSRRLNSEEQWAKYPTAPCTNN
jgi:hypothetical protein